MCHGNWFPFLAPIFCIGSQGQFILVASIVSAKVPQMDKLSLFLSPEMWPGVSVKRLWSLFWLQQVCILNTGSVILTIDCCSNTV